MKERSYREWDCVRGWSLYTDNPNDKPKSEKIVEATSALLRINDVPGEGKEAWREGVFVMQYPHWVLPKSPVFIQCLKSYVRDFSETKQRLVLVVPEGFQLPKELENDIVMMDLDLPSRTELSDIYRRIADASFGDNQMQKELFPPGEVESIISIGSGMTEMEFETAVGRAMVSNKATFPNIPLQDFCRVVRESKTEVVRRSEVLELMSAGRMEDVGGLDILKGWVAKRRVCFSKDAKAFGVDKPKGIALIGPPGTGKSVSAKAIAALLGIPLIRFDVGKVFNSLVGESESRVRSALKLMEAMSPCVAFVDEVDKAGIDPRKGGGDSGVGQRVMGALLTFMQESQADIFWIMTANRVDSLPPEMLRKGRLDEVFAVLPPNNIERLEVLRIHLRNRKQDPDAITDLALAVDASNGFVSAELEAAVKEAIVDSYHANCSAVTGAAIATHLFNMKPLSVAFPEDFEKMRAWAEANAKPASSPSAEQASRPRERSRAGTGGRKVELN